MNTTNIIFLKVFIGSFLFGVFGIFPAWIWFSHHDRINHDRYLILDEPNKA